MDLLVLRLIHIVAGAFWVGAVLTNHLFVQPAAAAVAPDAARFMYQLLHHRRMAVALLVAGATTVLAGLWLLVITSNGLDPDVLFATSRLGYTVGGVIAIAAFGIGSLYVFPRTRVVERIIGRTLAEARPPTPEEQSQLGTAMREGRRAGGS
jgi:uncharacterized membrane protein